MRPASIKAFERLFLGSLAIAPVQAWAGWEELSRRAPAATIIVTLALTLFTLGASALLISRGRSRGAKWLLIILLLLGMPLFLLSLREQTLIGWVPLAIVQAGLQATSIGLLFTPSARNWLERGAAEASG